MSKDNGILIRKVSNMGKHEFFVYEYRETTDEIEKSLGKFDNLEEALEYASDYPSEYGVCYEKVTEERKIETTFGWVRGYHLKGFSENLNLAGIPCNAKVTIEWKE